MQRIKFIKEYKWTLDKQTFIQFKQLKTGETLYGPDIVYSLENGGGDVVFRHKICRSDESATDRSGYDIIVKTLPSKVRSIRVSFSFVFEGIYNNPEQTAVLKQGGGKGRRACSNDKFNELDCMSIITYMRIKKNK